MWLVRWFLKHLLDLVFGGALALFIGWLIRHLGVLSFRLGENAVLGVIDDQIAERFGLTAPLVVSFFWNWAVPPALAIVAIWAYHLVKSGGWANPRGRRKLLGLALVTVGGILLLAGVGLLANTEAASEP